MPPDSRPRSLRVAETWRVTPSVLGCRLELGGRDFPFEPGQAITLQLPEMEDRRERQRTFSLASSPTEDYLLVATRHTGSPFKQRLEEAKGDDVGIDGPFGEVTLDPERPAVMVTGGIGITPFRSMLRYAVDRKLAIPLVFLYSNRAPEEIAFREELERWAEEAENLSLHLTITRPDESERSWSGRTGRIDADLIREATAELERPLFYVCGPPGLVRGLGELLSERLDVPDEDIRSEEFTGY